jgi:lipopolysaccharide/colanic/teichoic acid biosynthesis glycosyltransferase
MGAVIEEPKTIPTVSEERLVYRPIPRWKRALDIVCVLLFAPLWVPLGILAAAVIRFVSPGPVFFKQERVGFMGRRFLCYKFRTMKVNADTGVHRGHLQELMTSGQPMVKLDSKGDPRLIPGGLILRTLGIDELPQLINVLRGDMSLVGPRPCIPYEFEHYEPRYKHRCETLPGLTGLWQVNGKNRTTFDQMIDYDVRYAQTKTLLMDVAILARTPLAIVLQALDVRARRMASRRVEPARTATPALMPSAAASRPIDQRS